MNQRFAILDLGTNTFHLLIADVDSDRSITVVYKAEEFVQLGEQGVEVIGEQAFKRGLEQIRRYKQVIDTYQPQQIIAFGTAAIRSASNGSEFVESIQSICPMEVRKISGDEEAELICLGVRRAVNLTKDPVLIMDIGGGSTEVIIANDEQLFWKKSFPAEASVLKRQFHHDEPISKEEIVRLKLFLEKVLEQLFNQRQHYTITRLVGASGSFDTFAGMLSAQAAFPVLVEQQTSFDFSPEQIQLICQQLVSANLQQRLAMKGMKSFRAGMIVVAAILTDVVLQQFSIQQITQSAYELKEGVLWKLIQKENV